MDPSIVDCLRENPEHKSQQQEEPTKYKSIDNYVSVFNQDFLKTLSPKLNAMMVREKFKQKFKKKKQKKPFLTFYFIEKNLKIY